MKIYHHQKKILGIDFVLINNLSNLSYSSLYDLAIKFEDKANSNINNKIKYKKYKILNIYLYKLQKARYKEYLTKII